MPAAFPDAVLRTLSSGLREVVDPVPTDPVIQGRSIRNISSLKDVHIAECKVSNGPPRYENQLYAHPGNEDQLSRDGRANSKLNFEFSLVWSCAFISNCSHFLPKA